MSKTIDSQTLEAIHLFAATISKEVQFKKIILFGSRARQNHNPDSDADLAIVLEEPYQDFIEIKLKLNVLHTASYLRQTYVFSHYP